jgi:uncharacterized delta-60 repeat protein
MKSLIIAFSMLIVSVSCYTQSITKQWVRTYNGPSNAYDYSGEAVVDNSGNIYVCGQSDSSGTGQDIILMKYNSAGVRLWLQRYNGPANNNDSPTGGLVVDNSGNAYVAGTSWGANNDYVLIKYNSSGVFQWAARFNGSAGIADQLNDVALDNNGNIYVTGHAVFNDGLLNDYLTIKYNSNGDTLWTRRFDGGENPSGGPQDYAYGIDVDNSGNVYVTGRATLYPGNAVIATIKYNTSGVQQWVKFCDRVGFEEGHYIKTDNLGNSYVSGWTSNGTNLDYITLKYNSAGDTQWVKLYNGPGNQEDRAFKLAVDVSGNVYVTGKSWGSTGNFDFATLKYSPSGSLLWEQRYNGTNNQSDDAYLIVIDNSSNIYVGGASNETGTGYDMTMIKYNPDGQQQWIQKFDTLNGQGGASSIVLGGSGNIYLLGSQPMLNVFNDIILVKYSQPILADTCFVKTFSCASSGSYTLGEMKTDGAGNVYSIGTCAAAGNYNIVTVKYNNSGTLQWAQTFDSTTADFGTSLDIDASGNVIVAGTVFGFPVTIKYNSSGARLWLKAMGSTGNPSRIRTDGSGNVYVTGNLNSAGDIYIVKYDAAGNQQWLQTWNGPANDADYSRDMVIDNQGNVVILGDTKDPGPLFINNFVTIKYNSAGALQWAQFYNRYNESAISMAVDKANNIIITGKSHPSSGVPDDIATVKYNPSGVQQWAQIYNGPANNFDYPFGIAADTLGNIIVAGTSQFSPQGMAITIKYNSGGSQQWINNFSYYDSVTYNVSLSADAAGNIYTIAQARYNNAYYLITNKYSSLGSQLWQKVNSGGSSQNTLFYRKMLSVDNLGNLFSATANTSGGVENLQVIKYCQDIPVGFTFNTPEVPESFSLKQNYPNPFNPMTKIKFNIPSSVNTKITVYDILGKEIKILVNAKLNPGSHEVDFDGTNLPSGVYFYKLETEAFTETKKMMLIK